MNERDSSLTLPRPTPLLSILIPTKDRYETLVPVVEQILSWIDDHRLEIVICDNSTLRDDASIERLTVDMRVSYNHSDADRSVVDNTEAGIALCDGDYLCFIGDDDLVSPHIMAIVDWLVTGRYDCLIYPPARYWWNSVHFAKESRYQRPGAFWLPKDRDGAVARHDSATELALVLKRGGVAYMNLPRLYHGIVSRGAMRRIHDRFGRYVPGSSPDMALCIALALTTPTYASIAYPVTVFGAARNSGGGWTAARKHYGRIEDQPHLPRDILINWDPRLPRIWSEQIIYPQTIHEVLMRGGSEDKIDHATLYGSLLAYEPYIIPHLRPILTRYLGGQPARQVAVALAALRKIAGRIRVGIRAATGWGMPYDLDVHPSIAEVMDRVAALPLPAAITAAEPVR